jgi:hypothetical protein
VSDPENLQADFDGADRVFAEMLQSHRPTPAARFRGALSRRLAEIDPGYGPRPANLWLQVLALLAAGVAILIVAALLSAGTI